MRESIQHKLDAVRPPRVQITYDVEVGNAVESRELPFVMGVLADLSGMSEVARARLKDRKFIELSDESFDDVMESIKPRVVCQVANKVTGNGQLKVDLTFLGIDDFEPLAIIHQTPALKELFAIRTKLSDLTCKLDGNEELNKALDSILKGGKDAKKADAKKVVDEGKMVRDESQREYAHSLVKEFLSQMEKVDTKTGEALAAINQRIQEIDAILSAQLDEILHNADFQKVEGVWRGLWFLVSNSDATSMNRIRLLNITKAELMYDLEKAVEFDQSQMFKKIYEEEYGTFGGSPFSALVGSYEFNRSSADVTMLTKLSQVAAAAHSPFIASADPSLFDLENFSQLGEPRDISMIFTSTELGKWQSFRETEDSRYVSLTLPHMLARAPYGPDTNPVWGLNYTENVDGTDNSKFCWTSSAWAMAQKVCHSALLHGWPACIRGVENGGLVEDLPYYTFKTTDGDVALKCPTEVAITDRREKEISDAGFIALCHCKNRDYAAFFGSQTCQKPKKYNLDLANANANLSARLSYILAASRFAHYIKVIMRDKIGSFMSRLDVERYLNNWITTYVLLSDEAGPTAKARYPLRAARVDVVEVPGESGCYKATVFLRPHYQLEELTASIRLVARLPKPTDKLARSS